MEWASILLFFVTNEELSQMIAIEQRVVTSSKRYHYSGCLYGGFMLTKDGLRFLEFALALAIQKLRLYCLASRAIWFQF